MNKTSIGVRQGRKPANISADLVGHDQAIPPLYLTYISHNEEPSNDHLSFLDNPAYYLENRECVRQLGYTLRESKACLNFQSDWNFLMAAAQYEAGDVISDTGEKNILRWLVEDMGFEADPHAHETRYNYADVAYLHTQLGVTPSRNVGGFLYDPPDNPQGWEKHVDGIYGAIYPSYFWQADVLWGAGTLYHRGNDEHSYGVWRPKDRYNFAVDDPHQRLVNIGCGCLSSYSFPGRGMEGVARILAALSEGNVPRDGFYTATIFIPQDQLNAAMIEEINRDLDWLAPYVDQGRVVWSTLTETAQTWKKDYQGRPFRLSCTELT